MCIRDEENKIVEQVLANNKKTKQNEKSELFKAHPVPIESQIPLFDKIMEDQQKRLLPFQFECRTIGYFFIFDFQKQLY